MFTGLFPSLRCDGDEVISVAAWRNRPLAFIGLNGPYGSLLHFAAEVRPEWIDRTDHMNNS